MRRAVTPPILVIVTGSRDWSDRSSVTEQLDRAEATARLVCVIEGGARGADRIAGQWAARARRRGIGWVRFAADWGQHGAKAGPKRNQEMVEWALAARERCGWLPVCLAFPGPRSRGTWDMVRRCKAAGIAVREVRACAAP